MGHENGGWMNADQRESMKEAARQQQPTEAGYYWALWIPPAGEKQELTTEDWEIVHVWENFLGEPCEADRDEKFRVDVHGVEGGQWLSEFKWGSRIMSRLDEQRLRDRIAELEKMLPAVGFPDAGVPGTLGRRLTKEES